MTSTPNPENNGQPAPSQAPKPVSASALSKMALDLCDGQDGLHPKAYASLLGQPAKSAAMAKKWLAASSKSLFEALAEPGKRNAAYNKLAKTGLRPGSLPLPKGFSDWGAAALAQGGTPAFLSMCQNFPEISACLPPFSQLASAGADHWFHSMDEASQRELLSWISPGRKELLGAVCCCDPRFFFAHVLPALPDIRQSDPGYPRWALKDLHRQDNPFWINLSARAAEKGPSQPAALLAFENHLRAAASASPSEALAAFAGPRIAPFLAHRFADCPELLACAERAFGPDLWNCCVFNPRPPGTVAYALSAKSSKDIENFAWMLSRHQSPLGLLAQAALRMPCIPLLALLRDRLGPEGLSCEIEMEAKIPSPENFRRITADIETQSGRPHDPEKRLRGACAALREAGLDEKAVAEWTEKALRGPVPSKETPAKISVRKILRLDPSAVAILCHAPAEACQGLADLGADFALGLRQLRQLSKFSKSIGEICDARPELLALAEKCELRAAGASCAPISKTGAKSI